MGFFELCVHQFTRILDLLRVLKHQSNVNLYLSFPEEKVCLQSGECEEMHRGSFGFSEYPLKEEQERAVKELISGNDV